MKRATCSAFVFLGTLWPCAAQTIRAATAATTTTTTPPAAPTFDSSGDALLTGSYYFRDISYVVADASGDLKEAAVLFGTMVFDGKGGYTIAAGAATLNDSSQPPQSPVAAIMGTYTISASGYGYISHPLSPGDDIYGLAAKLSPFQAGVFTGSATENTNRFNDWFMAAPMPASLATSATLSGVYSVAYLNLPITGVYPNAFNPANVYEAFFQMTADGQGDIGTVTINGSEGSSGPFTATEYSVSYAVKAGLVSISFPVAKSLLPLSGTQQVYISPDGNFIFGGSPGLTVGGNAVPGGWDMLIGVRGPAGAAPSGLYYEAGMKEDLTDIPNSAILNTYYGSFSINGGMLIGDRRILQAGTVNPAHRSYTESYVVQPDGTSTSGSTNYVTGDGGAVRIGYGVGPQLSLSVAIQAPPFNPPTNVTDGTSVYLSPAGVVSSATFAPFTAGIAPGELLTLYGANLTAGMPQSATEQPLPTTLGGTQVMINGTAVPMVYVSAGQINALAPYTMVGPIAAIQVMNGTLKSNTITEFVNETNAGVFAEPSGGVWFGAILHGDYSAVTAGSPAQAGETVLVYATGLGALTAGASYPFTTTTYPISVLIGAMPATLSYSGGAPGFEGLYQLNVLIPPGVASGNQTLTVSGPDSATNTTVIPIG